LLALPLELKTKTGRLHGKQKGQAEKNNWIIARSGNEAQEIIDKFINDVDKIVLDNYI
jgi:hypothetical protein